MSSAQLTCLRIVLTDISLSQILRRMNLYQHPTERVCYVNRFMPDALEQVDESAE
jgi:hypothetical protein